MWLPIFVLTCMVYSSHGDTVSSTAQTLIHTPVGTIQGLEETLTVHGQPMTVRKFLGIPYAENPTGNNRFRKPVPKAAFSGIFNATRAPPACFQGPFLNETHARQTEDCLMLNVYVPENVRGARLSVMVWVHGGAFLTGTSSGYTFQYLSLFGRVIVVTINYRLAEFGFLRSMDGRLIGNQGLWDQHLAFQWVNKNIASFHGDPSEVTIFGESAGSTSVTLHALYAGNKGLFRRVIGESGSALRNWGGSPTNSGEQLVKVTGCDRRAGDAIECLRSMTASQLHTYAQDNSLYYHPTTVFLPVVDGDFLVESPHDIVYGNNSASTTARDFFGSVDIMTGVNNQDGAIDLLIWPKIVKQKNINNLTVSKEQFEEIVAEIIKTRYYSDKHVDNSTLLELIQATIFEYSDWSDLKNNTKRLELMINLASDVLFFVSAVQLVDVHSTMHNGRTYFYEFSADASHHVEPMPDIFHGANHADELSYLLGGPYTRPHWYTDADRKLSHNLMTMWTNFAISGNHNLPVNATGQPQTEWISWPMYDAADQRYLQIDYHLTRQSVKQHFNPRRHAFWTYLVPAIIRYSSSTTTGQQFNPNVDIVG